MSDTAAASSILRRPAFLLCAGLVVAVVALYVHVFQCDFIDFDDVSHVIDNPCVVTGLTWPSIQWAFSHFVACQWIPLSWISHMADVNLFGMDPGRHHLGNVLIHALNSCLVFAVFRRMTGDLWPSAAVAALFAVHPINVESVAWIAERKNVLSTFFWLLAMGAYARHAEQPRGRWMWVVAACMALGLLAKPMLVTLPCALLLLDIWPLRRVQRTPWLRLVWEKAPLFLLSAASSATTLAAARHENALMTAGILPIQVRLENAVLGYAAYLRDLFWPSRLIVLNPLEAKHAMGLVLGASLLLLAITTILILLRKRQPFLLIGWLWFVGILVPVSSIFQVGTQAYANRFTYIPQLGIFWGIVWGLRALPRPAARWLPVAASVALAILSLLTVQQVQYWTDTVTLFEYNLRYAPNDGVSHAIAGMGYVRRRDYPSAIAHYREAKRLMPSMGEVRSLLGEALTHTGQKTEALEQLKAAVALNPKDDHARRNLVTLLVNEGRLQEAAQLVPR
jgi:hypothetical protein